MDSYAHELNRLKAIYKASARSFQETILPNARSTVLIRRARSSLLNSVSPDDAAMVKTYIALHIRRGDRRPSFYNGRYIPSEDFVQAAIDAWERLNPDISAENLFLYVASDSARAYEEILRLTETRYTSLSLFQSEDPELRALASPQDYVQSEFDRLDEKARILATRGVIVDFALVSGFWVEHEDDLVPTATVCMLRYDCPLIQSLITLLICSRYSSNICKLSALGLGWERGFGQVDAMGKVDDDHKRWVEVDQKGLVVPVWAPFELF